MRYPSRGSGDLDVEVLEMVLARVQILALPAGGAVPGGNECAVDQDGLALGDGLFQADAVHHQDFVEQGQDAPPDPRDRRLPDPVQVGGANLDHVLAQEGQGEFGLAVEAEPVARHVDAPRLDDVVDSGDEFGHVVGVETVVVW